MSLFSHFVGGTTSRTERAAAESRIAAEQALADKSTAKHLTRRQTHKGEMPRRRRPLDAEYLTEHNERALERESELRARQYLPFYPGAYCSGITVHGDGQGFTFKSYGTVDEPTADAENSGDMRGVLLIAVHYLRDRAANSKTEEPLLIEASNLVQDALMKLALREAYVRARLSPP